jgi:uncharacterized protein YqhQ
MVLLLISNAAFIYFLEEILGACILFLFLFSIGVNAISRVFKYFGENKFYYCCKNEINQTFGHGRWNFLIKKNYLF